MATTTNYGWTTPDDTALVKDGAAAIRSLGTSVDTTTKNLNPETTLGDLAYRSSTANVKTRLGLGTAGQVLQVNSGANAPEWATLAGGGANWSLLNTGGTSLTGTEVSITGISGKDKILILVSGASTSSAADGFNIRINSDSGATNYAYFGNYASVAGSFSTNIFDSYFSTGTSSNYFGAMTNSDTSIVSGGVLITGGNATGFKSLLTMSGSRAAGGVSGANIFTQGIYKGTSVITSVQFRSDGSSFDAGTLFVYASA